jgi:hypothetical protein
LLFFVSITARRVVNAIPYVVDAPPDLLSPLDIPTTLPRDVFGWTLTHVSEAT